MKHSYTNSPSAQWVVGCSHHAVAGSFTGVMNSARKMRTNRARTELRLPGSGLA